MNNITPTPLVAISEPIAAELQSYRKLFEDTLCHDEPVLSEALSYIRGRAGKMMRPMLVLLMAKEAGQVNNKTLSAAVSLELLHTASLVHDDVVDESNLRRGKASVNQKYGNKIAILVGDYLLSLLLTNAAKTGDNKIVEYIARLGGTLSEGEIYQLSSSQSDIPEEKDYFEIIHRKTAALFATCAQLGAMTSTHDETFIERARRFGELIGICFQIRDDIFDFYDNTAIGKPTGNDLLEGKFTLPAIYALRKAPHPSLTPMIERVQTCTASAEDVSKLVDHIKKHGGIDYALTIMEKYHNEATLLLNSFQNNAVREALKAYADYVTKREY